MSDQERNYDDLFEIAIINSKPRTGELFNWAAFKASEVKEKKDLPPYLIFGPLDEGTLVINEDGWFAQWKDAEQKAKVTVNWRKDTKMYSVSQVWMGIEGSAVEASDDQPFPQVLASLYEDGFPKDWEQKAKEYFESKYRISWLSSPDNLPCTFGLPNGTFRVLEFPILIKNIRNAQRILMHLSEENLPYGFFAVAQLTAQKVFYEVGKAPDWTNDIGLVLTQSIGETGLIPTDIPQREKIDGKDYNVLSRQAVMLQISIPFSGLSFMLKKLAETPMPIVTTQEMPLRRELTPVILPVNLDEVTDSFTVSDQDQGIKVVTGLMKTQRPFAELLLKDSQKQIEGLEKFSDEMLDKLSGDIEEESKK